MSTITAEPSPVHVAQPSSAPVLSAAWVAQHIRPGERYCGVILAADGSPSHHLFLLPGEARKVIWDAARAWATEAGGELPTRAEQSILFGNAKSEFEETWYWSGEQLAAYDDYAWGQGFVNGYQDYDLKSASLRARAVRRLVIE